MNHNTSPKDTIQNDKRHLPYRLTLAVILGLIVSAYTVAVVLGYIPEGQQLTLDEVVILVLAAVGITMVLNPVAIERLKRLQAGVFNLELSDVKRKLDHQRNELDVIGRMLPLLFPETERDHLRYLVEGKTKEYVGSHSLRSELRRLRSAGLIRMQRDDRYIAHIKNDAKVDLAKYVRLTDLGEYWAKAIQEMEKSEPEEEPERPAVE